MNYQFDEMISAPCRLGILATLVPGQPVSFTEMKTKTSLSDGNLHVQTRKLADVGYIDINKAKKGKRTVTRFSITDLGREQLRLHVMKLQKILEGDTSMQSMQSAGQPSKEKTSKPAAPVTKPVTRRPDDSAVWA